ncbi:hypothetical protein HDK77DRAFT_31598 [Phyllosticta capitalensis]
MWSRVSDSHWSLIVKNMCLCPAPSKSQLTFSQQKTCRHSQSIHTRRQIPSPIEPSPPIVLSLPSNRLQQIFSILWPRTRLAHAPSRQPQHLDLSPLHLIRPPIPHRHRPAPPQLNTMQRSALSRELVVLVVVLLLPLAARLKHKHGVQLGHDVPPVRRPRHNPRDQLLLQPGRARPAEERDHRTKWCERHAGVGGADGTGAGAGGRQGAGDVGERVVVVAGEGFEGERGGGGRGGVVVADVVGV